MTGFMKRVERVKEALMDHQSSRVTLLYADDSTRSVGLLEAIDELCKRVDIVDVVADDETAVSLFRAIIGPWDFSGLEDLAEYDHTGSESDILSQAGNHDGQATLGGTGG